MPILGIPLAGQIGLVQDIAPAELPPGAWSDSLNVRFKHGAAQTMYGDQVITALPNQPEWAISVQGSMGEFASWVVATDAKAYSLYGLTVTDITPVAATALPQDGLNWSGGVLGTVTILHNAAETPWAWITPNPAVKMIQLANWTAGMKAYTLRSFKQYLVALGVTKGGTFYPTMVKWSHPADPGTVPSSWDETDPTKDAGETALAETPGQCMDCVPLRDINVIYKQDSVWGMQYIGGVFVFRFYKIFGDFGIPARNCAVEYISGKHFVFTGTDLLVHDGNSSKSVVTGRMKSILAGINSEQLPYCFVCAHPAQNEVWFCYRRTGGQEAADTALVYNYLEETLALRVLDSYRYIGTGRVDPLNTADSLWDTSAGTWDAAAPLWSEWALIPAFQRLLGLGYLGVSWVDGMPEGLAPAYIERTYVGFPVRADKAPDMSSVKFVRRIWPRFTGTTGTRLQITFGTSESVAEDIVWRTPIIFTIGVDKKIDLTLTGKVMALRIETDPLTPNQYVWKYNGLDIDIQGAGEL